MQGFSGNFRNSPEKQLLGPSATASAQSRKFHTSCLKVPLGMAGGFFLLWIDVIIIDDCISTSQQGVQNESGQWFLSFLWYCVSKTHWFVTLFWRALALALPHCMLLFRLLLMAPFWRSFWRSLSGISFPCKKWWKGSQCGWVSLGVGILGTLEFMSLGNLGNLLYQGIKGVLLY